MTPITNDDTVAIFKKIVTEYVDIGWDELETWPGHTYFPDEEEYRALLGKSFLLFPSHCSRIWINWAYTGSSNGLAVGYFLSQHKSQLGQKHVSQIQIFKSDSQAINAYCMLLTIAMGRHLFRERWLWPEKQSTQASV